MVPPPDAPRSKHSPFVLEQPIGSGAAGTVYRARLRTPLGHEPAGAAVAVKFLNKELAGDAEAQQRLVEEGRLGQEVDSPYVARIHGIGTDDVLGLPVTWLVMEFLEGETLRTFLQSGRRPVEDLSRRIGRDTALGLADLHARAIVHRDIKPENLHLSPEGTVKVMDLGLAKRIDHRRRTAAYAGASTRAPGAGAASAAARSSPGMGSDGPAGTLLYAAPEVLSGRPATPQSDLWALGVVLYELATGRHPFALATVGGAGSGPGSAPSGGSSGNGSGSRSASRSRRTWGTATDLSGDDLIDAVLHRPPTRPSHLQPRISAFLEQLILWLLAKDPAARPVAASQVAEVLDLGEASPWWAERTTRAPALAGRTRLRRIRRSAPTEFVDRDEPLQVLDRKYRDLVRGRGAIVAVTGPSGIGRRRLLDEAVEGWLERRDTLGFLWGIASMDPELGRGQPFPDMLAEGVLGEPPQGPRVRERIEARLGTLTGWSTAAIARVARSLAGDAAALDSTDGATLLAELVRRLAQDHPLVIRIDRADQLDETACRVLSILDKALEHLPVLVLLTANPEGLPPEAPPTEGLELTGLGRDDFVEFATALFEPSEAPESAIQTAADTFGGSPGNFIEALEDLVDRRQMDGRAGQFHSFVGPTPIPPAPSHLDRVHQRVHRLPPSQQHVLQAAAVLGDRFPVADLAAVVGRPELQVLEDLSVFRGRVVRAVAGQVSFRHRAFRDALLRKIPMGLRQRLHRLAAFALQERQAPPLKIGLHLSRAGEHEACVPLLLDSLEQLLDSGSKRTARRIATRLKVHLNHLNESGSTQRPALLSCWQRTFAMLRARLARRLGDRAGAAQALRDTIAQAREQGDAFARGEALVDLADMAREEGQFLQALDYLKDAYEATPLPGEDQPRHTVVRAHALHAQILAWLGQSEGGVRHLRSALRLTPLDDRQTRAELLIELARLEVLLRHLPTANKTLARAQHLIARDDPPALRAHLAMQRGRLAQLVGRDGSEFLTQATALAQAADLPGLLGRIELINGETLLWRNQDPGDHFTRAEAHANTGGDKVTELAAVLHRKGLTLSTADCGSSVDNLGVPELLGWWLFYESQRYEALGRRDLRRVHLDEALDLIRATTLPLRLTLRILYAAGHGERARALVDTLAQRFTPGATRRRFVHVMTYGR